MNEQVTGVSGQSSRPPETARRLTSRRRIALVALAVAGDVRKTHKSVRLAFPRVGYQAEILRFLSGAGACTGDLWPGPVRVRSVDGTVRWAENAGTNADDRMVNQMHGAGRAPVSGGQGWVERVRSRVLRRSHPATQLGRFLVVGLGNTLLSFIVYRLLLVAGAWYLLAAPLAFAVGAVNGFVFNRRWTFGARDSTRARVLYVLVQGVGALSTSLLVLFFVRAAGMGRVWAYLAAIPPVTLCMFAANRLWTFAERN